MRRIAVLLGILIIVTACNFAEKSESFVWKKKPDV